MDKNTYLCPSTIITNNTDMKKIFTLCAVLLVAATAFGQNRYGIKSGSYKTEMDMMGQVITNTTYFDDYGAKEVTSMSMMGMEMTQIRKDGAMYLVNKGEQSVQEMPAQDSINYLNLTDETIAKYKVKETGKETVSGKECTIYTAEISQMGQTAKATVSVWNGFAMKSTIDMGGFAMTQKIVEITEGPVDAALFEVPKF